MSGESQKRAAAAYEKRQRDQGAKLVALRLNKETADLLNQAAEIFGSKTAALKAALEKMMATQNFAIDKCKALVPLSGSLCCFDPAVGTKEKDIAEMTQEELDVARVSGTLRCKRCRDRD
mgnify:CR=1 FL=1